MTATVVEVRAHDAPGLLWRVGRALGDCGLDVRAARVETLGAEVVDVFYVTDADGQPLTDAGLRRATISPCSPPWPAEDSTRRDRAGPWTHLPSPGGRRARRERSALDRRYHRLPVAWIGVRDPF